MVSKEEKKLNRVISFLKKGLSSLSDDLESTVKGIKEFLDSLQKAQKDLKSVKEAPEVQTVSTSSAKIATPLKKRLLGFRLTPELTGRMRLILFIIAFFLLYLSFELGDDWFVREFANYDWARSIGF